MIRCRLALLAILFARVIKKNVVSLHPKRERAGAILSLGSNAERKVRAARATMLPNGKALFRTRLNGSERVYLVRESDRERHRKQTAPRGVTDPKG